MISALKIRADRTELWGVASPYDVQCAKARQSHGEHPRKDGKTMLVGDGRLLSMLRV